MALAVDPKRVMAQTLVAKRGVNSGWDPDQIPDDQLAWLVNGTVRGGYMRQRPVWNKLPVTFPGSSASALFQGAGFFLPASTIANPSPQLVVVLGGHAYRINLTDYSVRDISPDSAWVSDTPTWFMLQALQFLVIQDQWTRPVAYDGARSWRLGVNQLPGGGPMAFSEDRIWVAQGNNYTAGDIAYGPSGTSQYNYADSILYNTENTFLNEGGAFSTPDGNGAIMAMLPVAQMDTALGQGPLMVFTKNGVFSNLSSTDRTTWKDQTSPIQVQCQQNFGGVSHFAYTPVNADIFYRSGDGGRSLRIVQRRQVDAWSNLPQTKEIKRALDSDDQTMLSYASSALFNNRYLLTCAPRWFPGHGVAFAGLGVLDMDILSAMDQLGQYPNQLPPAYDGLWTGLNILRLVGSNNISPQRLFAICLNSEMQVEVWELMTDNSSVLTQDNGNTAVQWAWESKLFDFGGTGLIRLTGLEFWVAQIAGNVSFQWYYRSDQDPDWHAWGNKQYCNTATNCFVPGCTPQQMNEPGYVPRRKLPEPVSAGCNTQTGLDTNVGYKFQVRCVVTGCCQIRQVRLSANMHQDDIQATCDEETATCAANAGCAVNDFTYQIN